MAVTRLRERVADGPMAVAARLLSETAHDLRSPLTSVRELVRLVYDGELGQTTAAQRELLSDAVVQCDVIASLVDSMLQSDRLGSGLPRTHRSWIAPVKIAETVDASIRSVAASRKIRIQWDGFDRQAAPLFGDVAQVGRLILNLLGNAIAASETGGGVLVRLETPRRDGMSRLSVSDHGPGMSAARIEEVQRGWASGTGGRGMGLAISRTLAALHFTQLTISSQVGQGTHVNFQLPAGGPASVATAFVRWREERLAAAGGIRGGTETRTSPESAGEEVIAASSAQRLLAFEGPYPRVPETAALGTLRLEGDTSEEIAAAVDQALQSDQRLHEWVCRTGKQRWMLLWDDRLDEAQRRMDRVDSQIGAKIGGAQMVWSEPVEQPIAGRANRARISERVVRDMLRPAPDAALPDDPLGAIGECSAKAIANAVRRLQDERQRLSDPLARQTRQLQVQAERITRLGDGSSAA